MNIRILTPKPATKKKTLKSLIYNSLAKMTLLCCR